MYENVAHCWARQNKKEINFEFECDCRYVIKDY